MACCTACAQSPSTSPCSRNRVRVRTHPRRTAGRVTVVNTHLRNRTAGILGKHGAFDACGMSYKLHRQQEGDGAPRAYCPACGNTMDQFVPGFPLGTIVKRTTKWLKSMRTTGIKRLPIDGRVVGGSEGWPIVEWSNGDLGPAKPDHILLKNAPDRTAL